MCLAFLYCIRSVESWRAGECLPVWSRPVTQLIDNVCTLLGTRPPGGPHVASSTNLNPITPIRRFPFGLSFPRMKNNAHRGRIFGKNDYSHLLAPSPTLAWLVYTYPDYQGNIKESNLGYRKPLSTPGNNHRIGLFYGFLIFSRTPGRSTDRTSTVTSSRNRIPI